MLEFEVQRCSRHCAKTGRDLQPGESFYSVLVADGPDVKRFDYCEAAWAGPPDDAIGWWKSQMPEPHSKRMQLAPNDVMLHYFEELAGHENKDEIRYVLALLMLRRRVVRLEESPEGQDTMELYCPRNEATYRVKVAVPSELRISEIQEELGRLLFADAS